MANLDTLAETCDAGTKVLIIGHENDIALYRALIARGVSDYVVAPLPILEFIQHVSHGHRRRRFGPVRRGDGRQGRRRRVDGRA